MDNKKVLAISTYLMLTGTVSAAPATSTIEDPTELAASGGIVNVVNQFGIGALNKDNFTYAGDVSVTQTLNTPSGAYSSGISAFNSIMKLGKTQLEVNITDAIAGSSYISGVRLKNGSTSSLPATLAQTVTAELGAGSTITINGNNNTELLGVNIEAGRYHINGVGDPLIPEMTAYLNENTTVTLNKAGNYSVGLHAYISGAKIKTKDGLLVNVNTENNSTVYGIRAQGLSEYPALGGVVELNGTTTINMVNGGSGTAGILAHLAGSLVTASKQVTVNNTTTDSTAALYGLFASNGVIDFTGPTTVTISGGSVNSSAVVATSGGSITLAGATINAADARAFYASGQNSVLTGNAAQYTVTGNILSSSDGAIDLSMTNGSTFTGQSLFGATPGTTNLTISGANSIWNMTGDSTLTDLTLDGATLKYSDTSGSPMVPKTLTVTGNYTGNNGTLVLNSVLGDDSSLTDKLVVNGDTAGHTNVAINNLGGQGAQTIQGIEIVQVDGNSAGTFSNSGRIVAGAFDYSVRSGASIAGADAKNWYLVSDITPPIVVPPTPGEDITPVYRPEAGSYMANMAAASKLFNLRLEDREGRAENSSMWLRQQGNRTKFRDSSGQIKTATNTYVIQGGGEVAQTQFSNTDRLGLGLMLGYGKSDSESGNSHSGYNSKGKVDGYSGGVYATWYQDANTLNGLYVDSWVQYSMLNGEVDGDRLSGESYDMNGFSASVESGYRMPVYQGENGNVFVTPQAQITWNGIKADDHTEANGTRVTSEGNNNVQTRLGVKLSRDGVNDIDKGSDKLFTVYTEVNWLHNTEQAGATMDGVSIKQSGNTNVGELKVGAEGRLNQHLNLWSNVAQQMGDNGYSDTAVTLGFKYKF